MRRDSLPPLFHSQLQRSIQSRSSQQRRDSLFSSICQSRSSLEQFHEELLNRDREFRERQERKVVLRPNRIISVPVRTEPSELASVKAQLFRLRAECEDRKLKSRLRMEQKMQKMGEICSEMKRKMTESPVRAEPYPERPPVHFYYPMPVQLPAPPENKSQHKSQHKDESALFRTIKHSKAQSKAKRIERIRKCVRKTLNCVLFIVYLKKFNARARKHRLQAFNKFVKNSLKRKMEQARQVILSGANKFLSIVVLKQDVDFQINEDDDPGIAKEKQNSLRTLLRILFEGILNAIGKQNDIDELLWFICKHGNYSCREAINTAEQLNMYCISPQNEYNSADSNIEKASIINTFFMKMLIYNSLLCPESIDPKRFMRHQIQKNLITISCILYEMLIDIQDEFMLEVPKLYLLGNWKCSKRVRFAQPLVIHGSDVIPGELISGFKSQMQTKRLYRMERWDGECMLIRNIVSSLHQGIVKYHQAVNKQHM